jgi:hypothetical protein
MSASQGHVLELKESVQANELCAGFWNLFTSSEWPVRDVEGALDP